MRATASSRPFATVPAIASAAATAARESSGSRGGLPQRRPRARTSGHVLRARPVPRAASCRAICWSSKAPRRDRSEPHPGDARLRERPAPQRGDKVVLNHGVSKAARSGWPSPRHAAPLAGPASSGSGARRKVGKAHMPDTMPGHEHSEPIYRGSLRRLQASARGQAGLRPGPGYPAVPGPGRIRRGPGEPQRQPGRGHPDHAPPGRRSVRR